MPLSLSERDRRPSLRELEALHALVESRKTTAAACKLGVSQPAISRAIQDLENRLGMILFEREGGRLVPTADGILLYQQSIPIFKALTGLGRAVPEEQEAVVRIIAPPTISHLFLPEIVAAFVMAHPASRIQIEVGTTADVISSMADCKYDFGITDAQLHNPATAFEPFRLANAHAVMRRDHPLAARSAISPADLDGQCFIALTRRFAVRTMLDRLCLDIGLKCNIVIEAATSGIAYELARAGVGMTIINPFPLAYRNDADMVILPFEPTVSFKTCFVLSAAGPPARHARQFMDFLRRIQRDDGFTTPIR